MTAHTTPGLWTVSRRCLSTLAIETSCDDTSVAILEVDEPSSESPNPTKARANVVFHRTITANSSAYSGIHPLVALHSHQSVLGDLVAEALATWSRSGKSKPTFVSATRGPGMRSNLDVGLHVAKGLSLAWGIPLVGVHHMQAHTLTPRLCDTMAEREEGHSMAGGDREISPAFPYLTVLASGGHTMLLRSAGLVEHHILAETGDIAIGDCLDKAARAILPDEALQPPYGKALHDFAFPAGVADYKYAPPPTRGDELIRRPTNWGWSLGPPLAESKGGKKTSRRMVYSFAGLLSSVERSMRNVSDDKGTARQALRDQTRITAAERIDMAREVLRVAFEHLTSRILLYLTEETRAAKLKASLLPQITTVVLSGGVVSSPYLRHVMRAMLDVRGFKHINLIFPPPALCTDNALMIAWTGMEMYKAGYCSTLDIAPIRKWSMDSSATYSGILGVGGWTLDRSPVTAIPLTPP
ncbi:hypothetical protein B0A48_06546 [Cryoendolithus antarcticus]|uniref:N(6)-L-threonylcarbamoyladenine synthase n=1 Tax=Cryoendolithus antarcticus TaxID=1507870 RepID=A0A1V8TBB4_9PEZI|nr:hypothetical protein B0A48_06546 [Cryoendolithus antarcticus]